MSTQPDPYKILGVAKDAQLPEIRSAHRKLVLKCHPDKVQDPTLKAQKQDEFQRVQTAYELLADEKERKRYDDQTRLAELREQMRAKAAASASSRQTAAAASPSSSRPTPTSAYKYEIHTPERSYKSPRQPSPGPRGYASYSRSYEDDHRPADLFEGVRTLREREKEKELERQRRKKADDAIRRAEKEAKEAAKEARRAEKKTRDKSRKRETESKKSKPYIETFDGESASKSDKKKSSKKHDERRERDRSTHREEVVPPATSSMPPPPIPPQYQSVEYQSKADAAMNYIQASRSKVPAAFARHVQPPAPTPPPVGSPFAAPAEDDDARRSSAKPRRNSAGDKTYNKPEVVDDPLEATPPTARPHMHKSATATGVPGSSPPRRDLPRTSTMPVEGGHSSRYAPGIARAQTFSGAYPELDPRGRGRTRHQAQIPESDSEDEYERQRRERKAHRSSKKHGPEARGEHVMQYRVDGGRTTLQNSYSRSAEPADAYGYYAEHTGARAGERPAMPARDTTYSSGYGGVQYSKVKTANYDNVQFSPYTSYREAYAA
uniref:WGS project CBMD000000000 data, contig CS3427_c000259 n=1 Tax=Fusarium pseudograminearum CS3427 TaxID=1318457 RepID=A0A096PCG3_FUSPS|nr:unnamed protein product [Fusarium pseudograminearum CS3427]